MSEEQNLKNLIAELESASDYDTQSTIGHQLKAYGDTAVELIAPRFLHIDKALDLFTQAEWRQKEAYLYTLEIIATRKAYEVLIEGMFIFSDDMAYWDELLDVIDLNARYMVHDLSAACVDANGRQVLQMNLLLALTYGLEFFSSVPSFVADNILHLYRQGELAAITYIYPVIVRIIHETQDVRFLDASLRLFSSQESDLRWMSIVVLSAYDNEHILMEIFPMLEDKNELVRQKAREALLKAGFREE